MPALLKIKRYIDNDVWKITFTLDLQKLPEADKELMQKFGEPEINVGGTFTYGEGQEYTLPNKYIKVRSGLPYTQEFDAKSEDFEEYTQDKAVAYQTEFESRYEAAFDELRENGDTFTGEYIVNI